MTNLPDGWVPRWSPEQDAEIRRIAGKILKEKTNGAIDLSRETDPLIDMPLIAALAGVRPQTPAQWIQRSKTGLLVPGFPDPADTRYKDKPQWRAISQVVDWLWPNRWPPGASGRPEARGNRRLRQVTRQGLTIRNGHVYAADGTALGPVVEEQGELVA